MISFNEYQQSKRTNILATECFNMLCDVGIDPNNFLEWLSKQDYQVDDVEIAKFITNNSSSLNEAGVPPKPTPLQTAMKDPARRGMVQRALQSLKVLQGQLAASIKRGGLLGKQPDFNMILNQTINAVSSIKENVNEAFGQTVDALASGAMGAMSGLLSGGFKGMVRGAKSAYQGSLDQSEINAMQDVKDNLDTLINALPDKNAPITKQLQAFNAKISPLIGGEKMAQAKEPTQEAEPKQKTVGLSKVYNEFKVAFDNLNAGKPADFPSIKDKAMKDKIIEVLKFSLPLKDGSEADYQLKNGQIVAHNKANFVFYKDKWYLPPSDITKPVNPTSNPAGAEVTDATTVAELNQKYPVKKVRYTFKGGKWVLPQTTGTGPMGALTGTFTEVDPDVASILSKKFPPQGSKNTIIDEIGKMIQVIEKGKSGMKVGEIKTSLNNRFQKDPNLKQRPDVINYIVDMFVDAMSKNESVYYTMDYSDYVSDLIKG